MKNDMMGSYYEQQFENVKARKSWNIIKEIMKDGYMPNEEGSVSLRNEDTSQCTEIFNECFSNVGMNLASRINVRDSYVPIDNDTSSETRSRFQFNVVTVSIVS